MAPTDSKYFIKNEENPILEAEKKTTELRTGPGSIDLRRSSPKDKE